MTTFLSRQRRKLRKLRSKHCRCLECPVLEVEAAEKMTLLMRMSLNVKAKKRRVLEVEIKVESRSRKKTASKKVLAQMEMSKKMKTTPQTSIAETTRSAS